jgi:hypothetical protein
MNTNQRAQIVTEALATVTLSKMMNEARLRFIVQFVTLGALVMVVSSPALAARYRIELRKESRVVSTRIFDSLKTDTDGVVHHAENGFAFELTDQSASCGIFLQKENRGQTSVIVSLIENKAGDKSVDLSKLKIVSKSGLLTKQPLSGNAQNVFPGGAGVRRVSVEAPDLNRTCTISLI